MRIQEHLENSEKSQVEKVDEFVNSAYEVLKDFSVEQQVHVLNSLFNCLKTNYISEIENAKTKAELYTEKVEFLNRVKTDI